MVQRSMRAAQPSAVMAEYGFGPLTLVDRFPVSMSGTACRSPLAAARPASSLLRCPSSVLPEPQCGCRQRPLLHSIRVQARPRPRARRSGGSPCAPARHACSRRPPGAGRPCSWFEACAGPGLGPTRPAAHSRPCVCVCVCVACLCRARRVKACVLQAAPVRTSGCCEAAVLAEAPPGTRLLQTAVNGGWGGVTGLVVPCLQVRAMKAGSQRQVLTRLALRLPLLQPCASTAAAPGGTARSRQTQVQLQRRRGRPPPAGRRSSSLLLRGRARRPTAAEGQLPPSCLARPSGAAPGSRPLRC